MIRVRSAEPLADRRLRLTLSDGTIVERDVQDLLWGPVFDRLRSDDALFQRDPLHRPASLITMDASVLVAPRERLTIPPGAHAAAFTGAVLTGGLAIAADRLRGVRL